MCKRFVPPPGLLFWARSGGRARTLCYFGRLGARNSSARCRRVLWQFLQGSACRAEATVPARCARAYFWRGNMRRTPETHRSRGFKEFGHTQAVSRFGSSLPTTACSYKNDGFRIGLPCLSNLALHTIPPPTLSNCCLCIQPCPPPSKRHTILLAPCRPSPPP